jgi:hypothetical protein
MTAPQFFFVETDLLPDFPIVLEEEDEDGNLVGPVDLGDFLSIDLRMRREDGTLVVRPIVIDDALKGEGHFEWAAGELTEGKHTAEIRLVRLTDSKPETIPADEPMVFKIRLPV